MEERRYSEEAAREILKRAVDVQVKDTNFTRTQLQEMAEELGIPESSLVAAEKSWLAEHKSDVDYASLEKERQAFEAHRRQAFHSHLGVYVCMNLFFFFINMATGFGDWWFIFPLLGWGVGLAIHGWFTYVAKNEEEYEQEFLEWREERLRRKEAHRKLTS